MRWTSLVLMISLVSSFRFPRSCMRFPSYRKDLSILHFSKEASSDSNLWKLVCKSEEEIEDFGRKMSSVAGNSDVILLKGDLGAGKTTFTRGLIRAKFEDETMRVTSPSYLLDNAYEYDEGKHIHHMDLYRLPTGCDLSILGIPEIYSTSLCIIEWPQRMGSSLPVEYLEIQISIEKDESRIIQLVAVGDSWMQKMKILFDEVS
jgi:tRNA threonylcarbamoyladenosine biosynthesis protein TsaE